MDVMIDIEASGKGENNGALVSIGAVAFDPMGSGLGGEFYTVVDPKSASEMGQVVDASTFCWWMLQSPDARSVFASPDKVSLAEALALLAAFVQGSKFESVWAAPVCYDLMFLRRCYQQLGMGLPWYAMQQNDTRTYLKTLERLGLVDKAAIKREWEQRKAENKCQHNALEDAKAQASAVQKITALSQ